MSIKKDIDYIEELIRRVYGASHVKHKQVRKPGGICYIFDNDNAVYAACHIGRIRTVEEYKSHTFETFHDEHSYEITLDQVIRFDGSVYVDNGPIVDLKFVVEHDSDMDKAAKAWFDSLEPDKKYLALVRIPKSIKHSEKRATTIASMITYDWGIEHGNA